MSGGRWRDHLVTLLIAFNSAFFGVALVQGSQLMVDLMLGGEDPGAAGALGVALMSVAWVFIGIGAYTAAVVTANTFTTIVAGRVREIAQYRLLGATAAKLRGRLAGEGLVAGVLGAALGFGGALLAFRLVVEAAIRAGKLPPVGEVPYTWFAPSAIAPALVAVATVWIAAWLGSRAVGRVSPIQALSAHVEAPVEELAGRGRTIAFWLLVAPGALLLAGGCAIGAATPFGVLVAFLGGVLSFTGIVVGGVLVVPRLMSLVGRLFGGGAAAALARGNAVRSPRAATRGTIGMVIGVALIVMFVVALATLRTVVWDYMTEAGGGQMSAEDGAMFDQTMLVTGAVMTALTAVSAVLAAIGMVSNLALAVIQRRRELGLLRAVGATGGQIRSMIVIESAVTAIVAIGFGALLGILYGWAGAQSTFGSVAHGFIWPTVPWLVPAAVAAAAILLALVAAIGPAIRATRVTPIEALAVS